MSNITRAATVDEMIVQQERLCQDMDVMQANDHFELEDEILLLAVKSAEKPVQVVHPFTEKYKNLTVEMQTFLRTAVIQKTRADRREEAHSCHKVTCQSIEDFKSEFNSDENRALVRYINNLSTIKRCEICTDHIGENDCHCHDYFCKRCHRDMVCQVCQKLVAYPSEIYQFQAYMKYEGFPSS